MSHRRQHNQSSLSRRTAGMALLCALAFLAPQANAESKSLGGVAPERVAIVVGSNAGLADEVILRYAEDDARRVDKALRDLGGFDASTTHVITSPTATSLRTQLAAIETTFDVDKPPFVFFYYSGHGDGANLHLSGTRLPLDEVHAFLDRYPSGVRVALVDSCKSGAMIRSKGARAGPAFDIDVLRDPEVSGKIVITSSSDDEVAQESDNLGGSFFTHFWVAGLYGQADANDDGLVTLEEAYRFAHFHTVHRTIEASGGVQHPSYLFNLTGEGSIILANLRDATSRIELLGDGGTGAASASGARSPGHYFVVDAEKQIVLTELLKTEPGVSALRLPAGKYQVRKREPGRLLALDVHLAPGETIRVSDAKMREIAYEIPGAEKGGLRTNLVEREVLPVWFPNDTKLRVATGVRSGFIEDMSPMPELTLGVDFAWRFIQVEPRVIMRGGVYGSDLLRVGHGQFDLGMSIGPRFDIGPVRLFAGVDGGLAFLGEVTVPKDFRGGEIGSAANTAFTGRVFGQAGLAVTDTFDVNLRLHGDGILYGQSESLTGEVNLQPVFGLGAEVGISWTFF